MDNDSRQEAVERLLMPLRDTLETRAEDEFSWSRAHVMLRMNLWWVNVRDEEKSKKKESRFKKLMRFGKRNEVNVKTAGLSDIESEWRNADGHLQLVRNKDYENDCRVEWLPGSSRGPSSFKVLSNGKVRMFRSQDRRLAEKWKQTIELRLISWENLLEAGTKMFKELLVTISEWTPHEATENRKTTSNEEIGRRKIARMQCSGFVLKELDAALKVGVEVGRNLRSAPNILHTATDVINFLSAAPYVGYAFRIVGLGLELAMWLARENEALQKAQGLLKKIVKNVVRALIYAKEGGDGVGFYDFLNIIEKCEIAGHKLEFYGFCSTITKFKNLSLGKTVQPTEMISQLEDLHNDLTQDLTLSIYHHLVSGFAKASLVRQESSSLSGNMSVVTPWPEGIPVSDGGSYVGNKRLLAQISRILNQDKMEKACLENTMVVQKCIVSGPGGMGKTELVKQYARSTREFYKGGVYWVEAEKEGTLLKSFQVIREQIRIFVGSDGETWLDDERETQSVESEEYTLLKGDCEKLFRRLGREKGAWLLIFDNADEINGDEDFRLKWIPSVGLGNVLVTTRLHGGHRKLRTFVEACNPTDVMDSLEKLGVDDARSLLLFHSGRLDGKLSEEEAGYVGRIVGPENLDGHPLALVQAGHYLRETLMSFKEYGELLGRSDLPEVITPDEGEKEEEKRSILKTFLPSKNKLSEAAKELLSVLCWLPPDGITECNLRKCSDPSINAFHNSSLQKYVREGEKCSDERNGLLRERKWIKLVGEVCKYGLIKRVRKGEEVVICAHRLVYAVERESLKKTESRLRSAIVTAIMLLQHYFQMLKNNSKTIPSHFHEKHDFSKSWNTANLYNSLGYFLNKYNTYSHGEAFRFYRYAANLGDPTAICNLGILYERGIAVEKNEKRAAELYGEAAGLGHADAMYRLALLYVEGGGVDKDEKRGAELFGKAAELGHAGAMYNLGFLYERGNGVEKDEKRGAELFGKAAELGHAGAMYNLGVMYMNGNGVEKDERRGAEMYGKAAGLGDASAMYNLGVMYMNGNGVEKDERRGAEMYGKAAELGDASAMYNLGVMYMNGNGVERDEKRGAELYEKAAELGHACAMCNLGVMYMNGNGVERDEKRGAELYEKAAELGNARAMHNLGLMYVNGNGVEKDEKRGAELYGKAAELGHACAIYGLALLYMNGNGVEKNEKRAAELYAKAAELGHACAMCNLAFMYVNGNGVEKDEKRGAELYGKAAEHGHANAIHNLGVMYMNGSGVEKDEKRGAELYGKAAELGHAGAMFGLGFMYVEGRGVEKDEKRGAELYGKAAELGHARAMHNLALLYVNGNGVEKDEKRGAELYERAAELGDAGSMYNLALLYVNGNGIEKDEKRGAELCGRAAELGHTDAMHKLALLYVNGNGVEKDEKRAAELYGKAAELGHADAMYNLALLYKEGKGVKKDKSRAAELFRMARSLGGSQ